MVFIAAVSIPIMNVSRGATVYRARCHPAFGVIDKCVSTDRGLIRQAAVVRRTLIGHLVGAVEVRWHRGREGI